MILQVPVVPYSCTCTVLRRNREDSEDGVIRERRYRYARARTVLEYSAWYAYTGTVPGVRVLARAPYSVVPVPESDACLGECSSDRGREMRLTVLISD